jgi:hypothetical protein
MATQYTSILKLALPTQGELSGTWGDVVNDNITSMVEEAIAGRSVINSWAANSHTLTTADGLTSESRAAMLEFTDTGTALSGAATVICPTATKIYVCKNGAGQTVTVKTAAGTGVAIPNGETMFVFCDGTNVVQAVTSLTTLKVGTGIQVSTILDEDNMASDSATALATQQSIKAYVDAQITAQDLDFAGDTGTGAVDLDSQTFTVAGTANEIETSASGQTITIGLPTAIVVTTITTTNVQATNIKANDGTAAITIADSTGQVTVTDAVLTTADINGGTADNVTIGGSTAAAGSFTTLGASGTTTLSGALALTGNLDINTNKFNVTAVDGNTLIAGTLGVTGNVDLNGGAIDGTVIGNSTAAAVTGTTIVANTSIEIAGTTTVSSILDEDNMASDSDTALATQQSIKAYVDSQVGTVDTLAEILANGNTTGGNDILFADNDKAVFGAGSDLQIYNDGSDSYITHTTGGNFFINDDGAGYLMMKGSDLYFRNPSNVDMIHAQSGGFVKLYHNAVAKLATTATGIDVTGTVTADGLTVDAGASDIAIVFDDNSVTNRYQFTTGGNSLDSYFNINSDATRAAHLKTVSGSVSFDIASGFGRNDISFNGADLFIKRGGTKALEVDQATGDLSLFEDTGTTAKFFWDASAESLGIGTSSPATTLDVAGVASTFGLTVLGGGAATGYIGKITNNSGAAGGRDGLKVETILSDSTTKILTATSNSVDRFVVTGTGNVGINETVPFGKLHISDTQTGRTAAGTVGNLLVLEDDENGMSILSADAGAGYILFGDTASASSGGISYDHSANKFNFRTNEAWNRMILDSSGNLLVGTTSTSAGRHFTIGNATAPAQSFQQNGTEKFLCGISGGINGGVTGSASGDYFARTAGGKMLFSTDDGVTAHAVIDSSGSLLVGTTSASSWKLAAVGSLPAHFTADSAAISPTYGGVVFYRPTKTSGNGNGFAFNLDDFDDTEVEYGYIGAIISGNTVGAQSGDLLFAPMSSGTRTERMRLDSSGNLLVGRSSAGAAATDNGHVFYGSGQHYIFSNATECVRFYETSGSGQQVGSISITSSATAFNTSSDERLKENITDAPAGNVDDIKVRSFDWKADGSHQDYGMVAQELEAVAPYAVTKGETEDDMWSVDYSKLVPMLIKEIQDLKAEVAALKGAN